MPITPIEKKAVLVDELRTCVEQFAPEVNRIFGVEGAKVNIDDRERDWARGLARDYLTRKAIMGDPLWYAQVLFTGPSVAVKEDTDGTWVGGAHRYKVMLYFEFKDADTAQDSSTWVFENMTDSMKHRLGVIPYFNALGIHDVGGANPLQFVPMSTDRRGLVPLESTGSVAQHVFTVDIIVRDVI